MNAIVLLSGGLDSTVLTYFLSSLGMEVHAVAVDYGQRHSRELRGAEATARNLGIDLRTIRAPVFPPSPLTTGVVDGPCVVPARNAVLLALALPVLCMEEADVIAIGACADDRRDYPDCRLEFLEAWEASAKLAANRKVRVWAPLAGMRKGEIVSIGLHLHVPWADTWSCYEGGERPCQICNACRARARGFADAGVADV
jgi:7-cyano-7-deazaguanine synthase